MSENDSKLKLTKSNVTGIISGVVFFFIAFFIVTKLTSKNMTNEEFLKEIRTMSNKNPPVMLDDVTRFDSVSIIDNKGLCFNYTLVSLSKDELDFESISKNIDPAVKKNTLEKDENKVYRDRKIPLTYKYFDKNGVLVHTIFVSEKEY
ncbi:MAG: hypothetical protein Q4F97_00970 [Bacteroidales bacterium]|nr:hypothetical protein [Bacteroidales bacterium]